MIASMDSVGESLFAALSLFRDRMSQRVGSAGFSLEWSNTFGTDFPEYGPRPTLQVFRILQEAVTNALKHSGGEVIRISIEPRPAGAEGVRLTVSNDGVTDGTAPPDLSRPGRGLTNMRTRAASIGASLSIEPWADGLRVVLDLPALDSTDLAAQAAE
jgi:signal transduction histidine kinase